MTYSFGMKLEANEFCWKPWKLLNFWLRGLFMATCVTWQHMMPVCDISSSCCFMQMYWGYECHHWVIMFNHVWTLETTTPPDHFKYWSACWIMINSHPRSLHHSVHHVFFSTGGYFCVELPRVWVPWLLMSWTCRTSRSASLRRHTFTCFPMWIYTVRWSYLQRQYVCT